MSFLNSGGQSGGGASAGVANHICNSDFEVSFGSSAGIAPNTLVGQGWYYQETVTGTPATVDFTHNASTFSHGLRSYEFDLSIAGTDPRTYFLGQELDLDQQQLTWLKGKTVSFSCDMQIEAGLSAGLIQMQIVALDGGGATVGVSTATHSGTAGVFERLRVELSLPATTSSILLRPMLLNSVGTLTGSVFIDAARLVVGDVDPLPYASETPSAENNKTLSWGGQYVVKEESLGGDDGSNYAKEIHSSFPTPMRATPTMTVTSKDVREDGSASDVSGNYTVTFGSVSNVDYTINVSKTAGVVGSRPRECTIGVQAAAGFIGP